MKVEEALQRVNRIFLDSAPVIYYIDMNPIFLTNDVQLKRVSELKVLVLAELE